MRLLIVEDEKELCNTISKSLYESGYEVDTCYDGYEALDYILTEDYDLIVLDLNLPGMDGMDILRELRKENEETKVLILSARSQIIDKVEGLDAGANDYMEKPEADQSEWKIENDKLLMTYSDQTVECEYADGKITITADGTTMILSQEKEEYEPYVPGKPVENPTMEDFKGEWICTLMDAFGMQMPVNSELTGFEMMLSIQEDKSELIIIESGEAKEAEAEEAPAEEPEEN